LAQSDRMTPVSAAATVLAALHNAVLDDQVQIQAGSLPGTQVGHIHYPTRTITIASNADLPRFTSGMMHELIHLERGPSYVHDIAADEEAVLVETARRLTSGISLPLLIRRDPVETARFLGVDPSIVRLAVAMASQRGVA
jgi:hypothetical protein